MAKVWTIKIAGPAGTGIKSVGVLLSQILNKSGYFLKDYSEYPSLVRGGHNTYQVSFSVEPVFSVYREIDVMVSLEAGHWQEHKSELKKGAILLTDSDGGTQIPLMTMCTQLGGKIYGNIIALGVVSFLLNIDKKLAKEVVGNHFGQDEADKKAFELGWEYGVNNYQKLKIEKVKKFPKKKMIIDGNEAIGWGLYKAGLNLFAAYPMTPATGLLHFLAKNQDEFKVRVIHPEDEIAAASIVCGASMAGGRSATGTSGGGFALMTESISLAGAAELGVVFYLSQRPGPATGMPTWTSQGDLLFAVNAGHGEFPKIVLAPGDQRESFMLGKKALNLANKFDVPVILISDKNLSESSANIDDLSQEKMEIVESKKAVPGKGQEIKLYNSYEHNKEGFSVEGANEAKINVEMRRKKIEKIKKFLPKVNFLGSSQAKKLIVCWGSVKGTILEALKTVKNKDEFAVLQIVSLWPMEENLEKIINSFSERILVENNSSGQLGQLLRSVMTVDFEKKILKYDGRPFFPEEIKEALK